MDPDGWQFAELTEEVTRLHTVLDGQDPYDALEKHDLVENYKTLNHKIRMQTAALFKKVRAKF